MDEESIWKPIPEFSLYEIDQFGQVRNRETYRIKKPHFNKEGTKMICMYSDQPGVRTSNRSVAKLVMELFGDPCPPDRVPLVEVIDEDRNNTHISNLRWTVPSPRQVEVTRKYDNPAIKKKRGHQLKIDIQEVLRLWDSGQTQREIAAALSVTKASISLVIRRYRKSY